MTVSYAYDPILGWYISVYSGFVTSLPRILVYIPVVDDLCLRHHGIYTYNFLQVLPLFIHSKNPKEM